MPHQLIEKTCVRISVKNNEEVIKLGSGVIVTIEKKYYILTASHCLGDSEPNIKDIFIEKQKDYSSTFNPIKILSIHLFDIKNDWALIEVEFEDEENIFDTCKLGENFIPEEQIRFCGYQNITNSQYRPFDGKIILVSQSNFQVKLLEDTFQQSGEDGKYIAQGLSGSGVYIIKNKTPYLIGILNSVKTDKAWHDDINCTSINCLPQITDKLENLSDVDFLKEWAENIEKEKTFDDLDNYKSLNNEFFNNLQRKNKIIYDSEVEANKNTQKQLLKYLALKENISQLENKSPQLYTKFQNIVKKFQDSVEDEYSRSVNNNNEAKDKKLDLKNDLKDELESIFPSDMKFDIADYQIIEWLLDCSFNFTRR